MTDPKARKVLIVEDPLLPLRVKELIARVLFQSVQVSFCDSQAGKVS